MDGVLPNLLAFPVSNFLTEQEGFHGFLSVWVELGRV